MTPQIRLSLLLAALVVAVAGCAHAELTGEDHRQAASDDFARAEQERAKFKPGQTALALAPRTAFADDPSFPRFYNPTASHLAEADWKMSSAFKHLEAARKLEKYEDVACQGISQAVRTSCPLIAPHLEQVEEGDLGVILHLKSAEQAKTVAIQMKCHLAFAQANNFDRTPCPLYVKGVSIELGANSRSIAVLATDANVAREVREEARRMFGEAPHTVTAR